MHVLEINIKDYHKTEHKIDPTRSREWTQEVTQESLEIERETRDIKRDKYEAKENANNKVEWCVILFWSYSWNKNNK